MEGQMNVVRNEEKPEAIYANGVTINMSVFEARLEFLVDTPNQFKNEMIQKAVADIRLSPQLAKTLALYLSENVSNYEKQFGALPLLAPSQALKNE